MGQDHKPFEQDFVKQLGDVPAVADRVRLTVLEQTKAIATTKERRLGRELAIKTAQRGEDDAQVKALKKRLEIRSIEGHQLQAQIERNEIPMPERQPDRFILHGRIVNAEDRGQPGLTVSAIEDHGEVVTFDCTDKRGYFKLEIKARDEQLEQRNVSLQVSNKQQAILYRGEEKHSVIPNRITYREISVGENGKKPCAPPPEPKPEPKPKMVEVPDLIDHKEKEAVKILQERNLKVGKRETRVAPNQDGRVIDQDPPANQEVIAESPVSLVIGIAENVRETIVARLESDPEFKQIGISANKLDQRLEAMGIQSREQFEELLTGEDRDLRDNLRLPKLKCAEIFKQLLEKALQE